MKKIISNNISNSIDNAIRSLYQLVVHIDEETCTIKVIDQDQELSLLKLNDNDGYSALFDSFYKNIHPEDRPEFSLFENMEYINRALSEHVFISCDCRIRHTDSCYYFSRITFCNVKEPESNMGQEYLVLVQKLDDQAQENRRIAELKRELFSLKDKYDLLFEENMTDAQTGCYNRKGLSYYESIVLRESREKGRSFFVCVLDLNGLKYLNDTFGHSAGDEAIRAVSMAIKEAAPGGSRIIRTGGDEFLTIGAVDDGFDFRQEFEEKIDRFLDIYNRGSSNEFTVSSSYGCVMGHIKDVSEIDALVEEADKIMYVMKDATDPYIRR